MKAKTYHFIGASFPKILETNSHGEAFGLGADITHKIAKAMNVEIVVTLYPLKRALLIMERGEADVIIGPYKSEERSTYLDFSSFYFYEDEITLYKLKETSLKWSGDLTHLKELKIGVIRGWSLGDHFNKIKDQLDIIYLNSLDQLFTMLKLKRIDVAIAHPREAAQTMAEGDNSSNIIPLSPSLTKKQGYFGFSKKRDLGDFKKRFEAEYERLYKSGAISGCNISKGIQ